MISPKANNREKTGRRLFGNRGRPLFLPGFGSFWIRQHRHRRRAAALVTEFKLATELVRLQPEQKLSKIVVSEAGASVYSASAFASEELPELDVTLRGAVSIARRLQDPLAELVKIDPKSIGVGQYQHDLSEHKLSRSLDAVVEDCVNAVGVDANTASAPLLARVSGIGAGLAQNIVLHRDAHGPFRSRKALKEVPRLGPKAFEQCAGFLRIANGDDPLDASGVPVLAGRRGFQGIFVAEEARVNHTSNRIRPIGK
jgi:competence ComEA-like helix-hairpin-helix protein